LHTLYQLLFSLSNVSDGSITTGTSDILSVTVSLTSLAVESSLSVEHDVAGVDWWVLAESPFGWYYYDAGTMLWVYAGDSYTDLSPTYTYKIMFGILHTYAIRENSGYDHFS
jgi:hypothetical protein